MGASDPVGLTKLGPSSLNLLCQFFSLCLPLAGQNRPQTLIVSFGSR